MKTVRAGIAFEATDVVRPHTPHAFWTLRRVAGALGEQLLSGPRLDDRALSGVSTDTRTMPQGALFVALRGENHDAHTMLAAARDAGAAAVVVERAEATVGLGIPVFVVRDTLTALGLLARAWRRTWGGTVVAVGGSNGKTSTKELLRAALSAGLSVHATTGNQNNLVGVPLTLLALPPHCDVAVVEVGTNAPGEIAQLRTICEPDIAVVTSIGEEHLEGLGDLAGVLREEAAIFSGVPIAVVPAGESDLVAQARVHATRVVTVGLTSGEVRSGAWSLDDQGRVQLQLAEHTFVLPVRGAHQAANSLLAVAVAQLLGLSMDRVGAALQAMSLPAMRGGWENIGDVTLINDAYNANPPSMRAALTLMSQLGQGRQRVAVLGTMRELGAASDAQHDAVARDALASGLDLIVAVGEFGPAFDRVAPNDPRVLAATDVEQAWQQLAPVLSRNALVLLKGSRGVRLERLLPSLTTWATS